MSPKKMTPKRRWRECHERKKCQLCGKSNQTYKELQEHLEKIHNLKQENEAEKYIPRRTRPTKHLPCANCDKMFSDLNSLTRHLEESHELTEQEADTAIHALSPRVLKIEERKKEWIKLKRQKRKSGEVVPPFDPSEEGVAALNQDQVGQTRGIPVSQLSSETSQGYTQEIPSFTVQPGLPYPVTVSQQDIVVHLYHQISDLQRQNTSLSHELNAANTQCDRFLNQAKTITRNWAALITERNDWMNKAQAMEEFAENIRMNKDYEIAILKEEIAFLKRSSVKKRGRKKNEL